MSYYKNEYHRSSSSRHDDRHEMRGESRRRRSRSRGEEEDRVKRKRRRSESASDDDDHVKDTASHSYNFEKHKHKLTKIFFREEDFVKHGSPEFRDFWKFLAKYQAMEKKKLEKRGGSHKKRRRPDEMSDTLGVPLEYEIQHSLNFKMKPSDVKELLNRIPFQDRDDEGRVLSERMVQQFQLVLSTYINFLQKEKFAKLKKLREGQAALPIAEYRDKILDTLKTNQVPIWVRN